MELSFETISSKNGKSSVKSVNFHEILIGLSHVNNDILMLDYSFFKYFASGETYNAITTHITNNIDCILHNNAYFSVYVNMKGLTIAEVDKHKSFIQNISLFLKQKYPNKLGKCCIYNTPFVFSQIYKFVSLFIDKDTQEKIECR
jgi:hypothetical protein